MATKDFSSVQEKRIARDLGWDVVSGSGARDFHPGDIIHEDWLGECKTHVKLRDDITFFKSHWDKICAEASAMNKYPALFVDNGSQNLKDTWVLYPSYLVNPDNLVLEDCKLIKQNVNIKFNHEETYDLHHLHQILYEDYLGFKVSFDGDHELGLVPYNTFIMAFNFN